MNGIAIAILIAAIAGNAVTFALALSMRRRSPPSPRPTRLDWALWSAISRDLDNDSIWHQNDTPWRAPRGLA